MKRLGCKFRVRHRLMHIFRGFGIYSRSDCLVLFTKALAYGAFAFYLADRAS